MPSLVQDGDAAVEISSEGTPEEIWEKHPEGWLGDFVGNDNKNEDERPHDK